jgi:adenosylcobinamide hydrolase
MIMTEPTLVRRREDSRDLAMLVWRWPVPLLAISSAPLGGGLGPRGWVLNAQVPISYERRDPEEHLATLAASAGLTGPGLGMLTAVDVRQVSSVCDEELRVDSTVGLRRPVWAAEPDQEVTDGGTENVGTVNIVAVMPHALSDAALVNAIGTATEAKSQALFDLGIAGTGTASDAVCILCPLTGVRQRFGGPRSAWGARLARAVHRSVLASRVIGAPQ